LPAPVRILRRLTRGNRQSRQRVGVRRVTIASLAGPPSGEYLPELADIRSAGRKLTDEEWTEVRARHDQYPA